ncbi:PREDICTED: chymotrypsin-1-like isoform X2 [Vollenhovia emeryi]|uniref:chymotrypsin-1-like isoform X2 n=1 Tax=Vollenhovia emeryi TaxID=411798 RepID=UPI0005F36B3C|nr:PREDICTED: chymotrypsin-1-like isoform X2 [Vollenhovia emeryi]
MLPFIFLVVGVLAQQTFAEEPEPIVGGQDAVPGEFPHQVSLRYQGSHVCGGSIIGQYKILTAAHCVDFVKSTRSLKIATGTVLVNGGQLHDVSKIVIHPEYSDRAEDAWVNDVAVITLSTPIQYNQLQAPIALATSQPKAGQQCTLSGWGQISTNGPLPRTLQKMNQSVVTLAHCQERHYDMPLTNNHLCAYNRYGIGACSGDSGGPLISNGVQVGITSWVLPCAKGEPDAYTSVYHHLNFIRSN